MSVSKDCLMQSRQLVVDGNDLQRICLRLACRRRALSSQGVSCYNLHSCAVSILCRADAGPFPIVQTSACRSCVQAKLAAGSRNALTAPAECAAAASDSSNSLQIPCQTWSPMPKVISTSHQGRHHLAKTLKCSTFVASLEPPRLQHGGLVVSCSSTLP